MKVRKKISKWNMKYLAVFYSWKLSFLKSNTVIKFPNYKNKCLALFALFQEVLAESLTHKIMVVYNLLARCIIISSFTPFPTIQMEGLLYVTKNVTELSWMSHNVSFCSFL